MSQSFFSRGSSAAFWTKERDGRVVVVYRRVHQKIIVIRKDPAESFGEKFKKHLHLRSFSRKKICVAYITRSFRPVL